MKDQEPTLRNEFSGTQQPEERGRKRLWTILDVVFVVMSASCLAASIFNNAAIIPLIERGCNSETLETIKYMNSQLQGVGIGLIVFPLIRISFRMGFRGSYKQDK